MLQSDPDRALMLRPDFQAGIAKLQSYGYTFDILVLPDQLKYAEALVAAFPEQRFVLNHLGKPNIRLRQFEDWVADIKALAVHENVYCKVSGMVTEADLTRWKFEDFKPYIDTIFECFGMERVMYGSDWPVCRLAATFGEVMEILENYTANFTNAERALFWAKNAIRFYNINMD